MAYDPVSRKVVLFGGFDANGTYLNDTWTFDGNAWQRATSARDVAPPARAAAAFAYDAVSRKVVLFGGFHAPADLGDTWTWDGAHSKWLQQRPTTSPPALTGPAGFTGPLAGHAELFGGFDGHFYSSLLWRWTGTSWLRLSPAQQPNARAFMVAATDTLRRSTVVFGGLAAINVDDTWTWDGAAWRKQSPPVQPLLRYEPGSAYDARLRATIVFGGGSGGVDLNDTWAWDGAAWTQLAPAASPSPREALAMAYDEARGRIVVFGGAYKHTVFGDTWEL